MAQLWKDLFPRRILVLRMETLMWKRVSEKKIISLESFCNEELSGRKEREAKDRSKDRQKSIHFIFSSTLMHQHATKQLLPTN